MDHISPAQPAQFDHLVVMLRDQLTERAPALEKDGYRLTEVSVHNLGSINRLIPLDSTYIELLGWPAGQPPARKEIADQPLGLDALVFRTQDAQATYERLARDGFQVNAVQRLERPVTLAGEERMARFDTVRFAEQPIRGLRLYFCQHLTPQYIWNQAAMRHENGAVSLDHIAIKAPEAQAVAAALAAVAGAKTQARGDGGYLIQLPNLRLAVEPGPGTREARISHATLLHKDGALRRFDPRL